MECQEVKNWPNNSSNRTNLCLFSHIWLNMWLFTWAIWEHVQVTKYKMASKRSAGCHDSSSSSKKRKCQVMLVTCNKWKTQYDQEYNTLSWLRCKPDAPDSSLVNSLSCSVCIQFEANVSGLKNFSRVGFSNHQASNIINHAQSKQHKAAMFHLRADQANATNDSIMSYSPIASGLLRMDDSLKQQLRNKFDMCYVLCKENMAFQKYPVIYELEMHHEVQLGSAYVTKDSAKIFTHYIAEAQHNNRFLCTNTRFYSFVMDSSTDADRIKDELIMIVFCKKVKPLKKFVHAYGIYPLKYRRKLMQWGW